MRTHLLLGMALSILMGFASTVQAAPASPEEPPQVPSATPSPATGQLNFNNADLSVVMKYISDKTGKPVIKSMDLDKKEGDKKEGGEKKITLINPLTKTDAENLQLLYEVLSSVGIAVVESGNLIILMPVTEVRKFKSPIVEPGQLGKADEKPVTYSHQLKFAKAKDLVDRLKSMVRDPEALTGDDATNSIIFTESRGYVERLADLISLIDRQPRAEVTTVAKQIRSASAGEMIQPLQRFLETYATLTGSETIATQIRLEPSLNTLIIRGPKQDVDVLMAMIDRLEGTPREEKAKATRRRMVNFAEPSELIRQANEFLRRYASISGFPGDVAKSSLNYEPITREIIIRGPADELDALMPVLDELDKPVTSRPRKINYADPETIIPESLKLMLQGYAEEGRPDYQHSITWKRDPFDPSTLVFRGPNLELDRLFPILNQYDKPSTIRTRRFYSRTPEEVFHEAIDLLISQYLHEGRPNYKPAVTWRRDPMNPANVIIRGPEEELTRIMVLIEQLDKPTAQRTRPVYAATPEIVIPAAIEKMVEELEREGQAGYKPAVTWRRDEFNPSTLIFTGPAAELDKLIPILDKLDKPLVTQPRRFYNKTPEEIFQRAIDLMLQQYTDEGRPNYQHSITWKHDPLNPANIFLKGPADELARLTPLLDQLDKIAVERPRRFYVTEPERAIPEALDLMLKRMADEGQPGYQHAIEWKRDELNPSQVIFRGPTAELDRLFPILEQLDKTVITQQRRFYSKQPEEVFPKAFELLIQQYADEGRPGYLHSITWKRDPLNPAQINIKGPQEEIGRLTALLDQLDKVITERTRQFHNAKPEEAIPGGIERMVQRMAEEGQVGYIPSITWRREEFNPAVIVFRGPPAELDRLFPILENLDRPMVVANRAVVNATAENLIEPAKERLRQYFKDAGRPEYEPVTTYRVDPLNGNLVMRGPQEEITALTTILTDLDAPRAQNIGVQTQDFAYSYSQPADLIAEASRYLTRRVALEGKRGDKPGVTYQINPLTKSISMRGPVTQLSFATQIMTALEQNTRRDRKPLVIYPKFTNVTQIYSELTQLIAAAFPGPGAPQLLQLNRLDALVVSSREDDLPKIREWFDMLDREGAEDWALRVVPIQNTIPSTLAGVLRGIMPTTGGTIYPDDAGARVIIRDSTPSIEKIQKIISDLDQPVEGGDLVLEVKNLKVASPYYVYSALNEFSSQLALFRGKARSKARVVYEPTSSSILFFGNRSDVNELMEVAEKLDRVALGDSRPRIIRLENSIATSVASQLSSVLPSMTSRQNPPQVIADARLNSLIVATSPADATKVLDLIKAMDIAPIDTFKPTIVKLENAEVSYLYSTLQQLVTGAGKIIPDYRSNSLIIMDTTANIERLMPYVRQLDTVDAVQDLSLEIYKTQSAYPYYMYTTLSEYGARLATKKAKARYKTLVQYDPYTANIIFLGEKSEVKDLLDLAKRLDTVPFADVKPVFIPLKNVSAMQITPRLSALLQNLTSKQTPPQIVPDQRLNTLIVAGNPQDVSKVQEVVNYLDVPGTGSLANKIIKLENAEASSLVTTLQPLLSEAGKMYADYRTNSILILDGTESINRLMPFIAEFDTAETRERFIVKVVQSKTANVYAVYNPLTTYAQQLSTAKGSSQRARPQVIVDPSTQAIIIIGREPDVNDIMRIAEELDKLQWEGREPEFIQLKNAVASTVAATLRTILPSIAKGGTSVQIVPDDRTTSLIVVAQQSDMERVKGLIDKLDVKDQQDLITRIIPMKSASAVSLYSPVYTLKSPRGYVTYDSNSNSLIIRDTATSVEFLEKVIQDLDNPEMAGEYLTEIRTLQNLDPATLASILTQLSTQHMQRTGRSRPQSWYYPESISGSLILMGVTEEMKPALEMVDRLEAAGKVSGKVKLFFLKYTKATQLATQLRQVFQSVRRTANAPQTVVISDEFTNSIIGIGSDSDLERLDELVLKLDIPNAAGLEVEIYPLQGVSASLLAGNLKAVQGPQGSVFADTMTNSLVVIDSPDVIQRIGKVVKELSSRGGGVATRVRKLNHGQAPSLVAPVQQFLQLQASQQGRTAARVGIYAEPSSNSVIIFGPTQDVDVIDHLIDELDTEEFAGREPTIYPLKYIQAQQIASQFSAYSQTGAPGTRPVFMAEPTSNSLIVIASDRDRERLETILKEIDTPDAAGLETRVYKLEHSSASNLAANIRPPLLTVRGRVFAEPGTNALVVIDTPESMIRVKEFIDLIDLGMGQVVSEVRRLINTSVTSLQSPLQQFITHQSQAKGLTRPLTQVMGDPASNSVIIYGPTDEVRLVMGLIDKLDEQSLFDRQPKIIPLQRAQASRIYQIVQQLLTVNRQGPNAPLVVADPESNSLIVTAPPADLERAEQLIATLDQPEAPGIETRVFRLKNADPQVLSTNIRPMVGNPTKLFFDPVSNALVYTDTTANLDRLAKLVEQLDTFSDKAGVKSIVRPLRNTSATTIDVSLSDFARYFAERKGRTGRPLTRVTADALSNSVLIIGPSDEVDQMTAIIDELDRDDLRQRQPKAFFLKLAQATQVAMQISQVMAPVSTGPNAAKIIPNVDTNSLIVVATPSDLTLIETLINSLDSEEAGQRKPQIYTLRNADAAQLVGSLRPTLAPSAALAAHPDSNSILFVDTEANVAKLFAVVEELDSDSRPAEISSEIITLENSKAGAITQPLTTIISQLNASRQRKNKPPLQAFADNEANAMVIVGSTEEVSQIAKIVRELDSESLTERKPEVFFLEYARAVELGRELTQLFGQTAQLGPPSRIVADQWSNALMVFADPRDLDWIRRLIKELDTREGRKRAVQIFLLENADASILAERLQGLFVPGASGGGRSRRGYDPYMDMYGGRRQETLTEGAVSIIPDQRLNALVVTAEPQDMSQVAELIDALDIDAPNLEEPRVYHIEYGEAEALAQKLQELFSGSDWQGGYYFPVQNDVQISSLSGKVRIIAEPTTNSIIVLASSPRAFEVVEGMLKELDRPSVQAGRTNIISVKNAVAKDLADLLSKFFKQDESAQGGASRRFFFNDFFGGASGGGGRGSYSNLIGKVRIEADTRTNSLLVITPDLYRPSVEELIRDLDAPTQQVLLEVLIIEVGLGNEDNKGIQWGVDPVTGEVGKISVSNDEVLTFDNDRSDFLNVLGSNPSNSVFTSAAESLQFFSLNHAQFDAVINFLESCRNVSVQSRPNILTENNRKALVRVGSKTPTIKNISTISAQTNISVEYIPLGLTLEVTPHVNSKEEATLEVLLTDGAIDPSVPALNGTAFTFTDRKFQTRLIVQNHHTAVLAGVISERESTQVHEVPILHRLPLVGNKLFTNRAVEREKVELLTFITPYILNSRGDLLTATEMIRGKSQAKTLDEVDIQNGDWPEVYADDNVSEDPWGEAASPDESTPPAPQSPSNGNSRHAPSASQPR